MFFFSLPVEYNIGGFLDLYVLLTYCTTNKTAIMFLGLFIGSFHHLVTVSTCYNSWCANWPLFTHSSSVSVEALLALKKSPEIIAKNLACYLTVLRITKPTRISLTYLLLHHHIDHVHCPSATLALSCNSRIYTGKMIFAMANNRIWFFAVDEYFEIWLFARHIKNDVFS